VEYKFGNRSAELLLFEERRGEKVRKLVMSAELEHVSCKRKRRGDFRKLGGFCLFAVRFSSKTNERKHSSQESLMDFLPVKFSLWAVKLLEIRL
jgi:hypothetical protein